MMNYIWSILFLLSFLFACFVGNLTAFGTAITEGAQDGVNFVLSFVGIMAMWSGLMEIGEKTGLIKQLSKLLLPFTRLLFPNQKDPQTTSYIIMSFMSNVFGAGNSSTVFALQAMERLDAQNHHKPEASNDMCMFAIVNMAFAPIIPLVTVELRQDLGSTQPYSIILPSLATAGVTLIVSILLCKILERRF